MNARVLGSDAERVVHHCTFVERHGYEVKVRVRLRFLDGDVVEVRAQRVLDNTLLGDDVPLTDDEVDAIVMEVLRNG